MNNQFPGLQSKPFSVRVITLVAGLALPFSVMQNVRAESLDCLIQPHQTIQVGSPVPGIIADFPVERGDMVEAGQVLARLRDEVEQAAFNLAKARAGARSEVKATEQSRAFAKRELARANKLAGNNFVSPNYVDKAATDASIAAAKHQQAAERRELALRELEVARAQLARRTIRSPISGVVVDRLLSNGEYVDEKPVARIAQINPLRVEVVVPAVYFGQLQKGNTATVTPQFSGAQIASATVTVVDRVVDAASNTFRVRLRLENPDGRIPPGLRCQVDLNLDAVAPDQPTGQPAK